MSDTHHCPFCELIFLNVVELQAHIASDHPERKVPDRDPLRYPTTRDPDPDPDPPR